MASEPSKVPAAAINLARPCDRLPHRPARTGSVQTRRTAHPTAIIAAPRPFAGRHHRRQRSRERGENVAQYLFVHRVAIADGQQHIGLQRTHDAVQLLLERMQLFERFHGHHHPFAGHSGFGLAGHTQHSCP